MPQGPRNLEEKSIGVRRGKDRRHWEMAGGRIRSLHAVLGIVTAASHRDYVGVSILIKTRYQLGV